ncbi:hypothetical protein ACFVG7_13895, partial [Streptomyces sp. NPDC127112]
GCAPPIPPLPASPGLDPAAAGDSPAARPGGGGPAGAGPPRACHAVTTALLAAYAVLTDGGAFLWLGLLIVAAAFLYEHTIVKPHDLSRLNRAFFTVNGFIGIALFVCALADLLIRGLTL